MFFKLLNKFELPNKMKLVSFLVLFVNILYSQETVLDTLLAQFDSYKYDEMTVTLERIDSQNLPLNTTRDSIRFSIYNLLKAKYAKNLSNSEEIFSENLDYLLDKDLKDYLPYFLTSYAFKFKSREDLYDKLNKYLELSISVSKENKNLSHYYSVVNLYNAYAARDIIRGVSDKDYKKEDLYESIQLYEANSNIIVTTETNLFKDYFEIAFSPHFDKETQFYCLKKTFEYAAKLDSLPKLYKLGDLINGFRNEDSPNTELKYINEKYYLSNVIFKHLSTFHFLANKCFIENFSNSSISEFINHYNLLSKNNYEFTESEVRNIYLTTYRSGIAYTEYVLSDSKKNKIDDEFYQNYFNFCYEFSKRYRSLNNRKLALQDLINFNESSDSYLNSDVDLYELDRELSGIIHQLIQNGKSQDVYPSELVDMIKTRASFEYKGWSEDEIEKDLVQIFENYKNGNSYENVVSALTYYWELELSLISMIDNNSKYKLEESRDFIASNLSENITITDIGLRIRLAKIGELESYKIVLERFLETKKIDTNKYNVLMLSLLGSIYDLNPVKSNAEDYCEFFMNNIKTPDFKFSITTVLALYVNHKIKDGLVKLSNYLLVQNDKYFINELDKDKYNFQISAGYFFKYIRNYKRSINFFLDARANNYHWANRGFTYNDLTRDSNLLYEIFNLNLEFDLNQSRLALESYKEKYDELKEFLSIAIKESPTLDKNMFFKIERRSLDMERRQLFYEQKFEASETIIDKMLELEKIKPHYGEFGLWKNKIRTRMKIKKNSDSEILTMLNIGYKNFNKPIDKFYIEIESILTGIKTPVFINNKLDEFQKIINDTEIMNTLSYENQINFMTETANKLFYLEVNLYNDLTTKDQLERLTNFKFLLDNIDMYNTKLLNLDENDTDRYFDLLNKRFTEKDYDKLNALISQFNVFQQRVKISSLGASKISSINEFQQKLETNQAYLRFSFVASDVFLAYVVTKDDIKLIKIKQTKIDKLVDYYTNRIKNRLEDNYSYDLFFKPIAEALPEEVDELFIKNYGVLSNINFEALLNPITKGYVFDDFKVNYIERPESIVNKNQIISIDSAFLFGNPDFTHNVDEGNNKSNVRSGLNPLPYTEIEVKKLNNILTASGIETVTTNLFESTEESLYSNSKSNIIHLATHGFYMDGESTDRFNWGLLASGSKEVLQNDFQKIRRNDGVIFGSEIILKNFTKAKLVVLSACETGYGTTTFFGSENLANSFLRAGAKNIISTLWPVDDEITQRFMSEFYTNLVQTKNINLSLRNTKLKIKSIYPDALYWAPFVLIQNNTK